MSAKDSPGYKRLVDDRKKYDDMVADTLRRQQEAMDAVKEKLPKSRSRGPGRKDSDYPPSKTRKDEP